MLIANSMSQFPGHDKLVVVIAMIMDMYSIIVTASFCDSEIATGMSVMSMQVISAKL